VKTGIILSLAFLLGACAPADKKYTERDLNRLVGESVARNRDARVIRDVKLLEQLQQGSVSNVVDKLESELDSDIDQLRTMLRSAELSDSYRSQLRGALSVAEEYRAKHPRERSK